jgi:hypothetical protein
MLRCPLTIQDRSRGFGEFAITRLELIALDARLGLTWLFDIASGLVTLMLTVVRTGFV